MQNSIPLEHRQLAVLRIESHQLSGYPKIIPALNFFSMKNVAAEVFCSTATSKCTKMEKRLDSLLKNNYHQRRKIAENCFNCLSTSFLPSTADAARAPPSQHPHTCKQTSRITLKYSKRVLTNTMLASLASLDLQAINYISTSHQLPGAYLRRREVSGSASPRRAGFGGPLLTAAVSGLCPGSKSVSRCCPQTQHCFAHCPMVGDWD